MTTAITGTTIATKALTYNGLDDGCGYPGPLNVFERELGRGAEYWCGDFVSAIYKMCGLPLPSMQPGCVTGFAGVPEGWEYAVTHGATAHSWEAMAGSLVIFDFGEAEVQHVELATALVGQWLYTVGGDSGPSNIDHFKGEGGVHRHVWSAPAGQGNPLIRGIIKTGKLVTFGRVS